MRILIPLLFVAVAFAGCTQGDSANSSFTPTCPSWVQSPGHPGATVHTTFQTNQTGETFEANMEGILIHKPTLIEQPWDWDGAILDVYSWTLEAGAAVNGTYTIKVWAASQEIAPVPGSGEEGKVRWDEDDKLNRLLFRDLSQPMGQQLLSQIVIESSTQDDPKVIKDKEYRIELASADETPRPSSIWIEYQFKDDDGDSDTPSAGVLKTKIGLWYRSAHCL